MTQQQKIRLPERTKILHQNFIDQLAHIDKEFKRKKNYYRKVFDLALKHSNDLKGSWGVR